MHHKISLVLHETVICPAKENPRKKIIIFSAPKNFCYTTKKKKNWRLPSFSVRRYAWEVEEKVGVVQCENFSSPRPVSGDPQANRRRACRFQNRNLGHDRGSFLWKWGQHFQKAVSRRPNRQFSQHLETAAGGDGVEGPTSRSHFLHLFYDRIDLFLMMFILGGCHCSSVRDPRGKISLPS